MLCSQHSIPYLKGGVSMAKSSSNVRQTSKSVASKASRILRDGRFSKTNKSVAGSALSQTRKGK
jgi:hypothetical protein